ncbi:solute carrier family 7 member 14 [Macaca nemestrina]|uniref:Solute carrier family 7 member 14 n=4 Tax=Cercopithecinae TaxID=9528 RepID=A0A096N7Z7_PAPAN|nr:probable cationic amino acid transporter [Papio anubis]XP_005546421.1 probable cationic amino acid transporter [Macaca fascicularis]XP_007970304.1 probable cationic amino acid transporter [Chlorocebus sabaeus]XP_011712741.1 probable cationic amino acid transporter [Macaca nemestrina]XP_025233700.1 probable cationic amino acid transporter [Theropithecus gelada]XP_050634221.1 probable cationic amino acid transporter [Macaca thibetana thibetana]
MSGFLASLDPRRVQWGAAWYAMHSRILRTKPVESMLEGTGATTAHGTKLAQVLTTVDLISLGVGSCVGTGMYVVSGLVAKEMAGPGVIVSFIIAAVASILSGVCYAEFGVRVPKTTGSAYTYSYVTVGEFVAFFIGWNLILEYLIGTAAGASALSSMFDSLANHTISRWMADSVGTLNGLGKGEESYPDLLALLIAVIVTIIVALGVKNSVGFNNVLNVLNLAVWVFIMIAGLFFINGKYWAEGQFLPHGWSGVLQGAATCFYAFIGFDIIATTGEEAKNPNTSIPYAITASLVICLTAYVSVSMILTLMVPYYAIDTESPLMEMFVAHGFYAAKFVVAIGSVAGLTVSLLGSLFPMPRVIYAMAGDGLLFRFLAHVSSYTETPVVACIVSGFLAALLALLVSLRDLIEMMSIGTLLAYTLVSVCVLLLRYQPESDIDGFVKFLSEEHTKKKEGILADCEKEACSPVSEGDEFSGPATNTCGAKNLPSLGDNEMLIGKSDKSTYNVNHPNYGTVDMTTGIEADESENIYLIKLKKLIGPHYYTLRIRLGLPGKMDRPTAATGHTVTICVLLLFILMFIFCSFIIFGSDYISEQSWWAILLVVLMVLLISTLVFVILQQPENPKKLPYMAPCLPFVPAFAMLVNIYLMLKLSTITWIRFAVWCFVGLLIYFGYGIWNSTLEISAREEALHQSTYQRYDVDDPFSVEEGFSYATEGESQEDWGGPTEDKGFYYQQMSDAKANGRTSSKAKSKSKHKQNSEALIANDELDYSPE